MLLLLRSRLVCRLVVHFNSDFLSPRFLFSSCSLYTPTSGLNDDVCRAKGDVDTLQSNLRDSSSQVAKLQGMLDDKDVKHARLQLLLQHHRSSLTAAKAEKEMLERPNTSSRQVRDKLKQARAVKDQEGAEERLLASGKDINNPKVRKRLKEDWLLLNRYRYLSRLRSGAGNTLLTEAEEQVLHDQRQSEIDDAGSRLEKEKALKAKEEEEEATG